MTKESMKKLLLAYRAVCATQMTSVAELLEAVILDEMGGGTPWMVTRGNQTTLEPTWNVTCGPDIVPLSATMTCTDIDHMSEEGK